LTFDLSYDLLTSWLSDIWPSATLWVARSLKHITHDRSSTGEEWWLVYTDPVDVVVCVGLLYVVRWVDVDCGVWLDNHLTDIRVTLSTNIDAQFYHKDTRWHDQQPSQREGRMNYPSHLCQVRAVVNTIEEVEGELYFPFPSPLLMSLPISSPLRFASSPGRCRSFSHVPHCCATSILRVCGKRRWDISKFWVKDSQKVFTEISTMVDCFPEHLMETLISSYFRKVQIFSQTTIPSPMAAIRVLVGWWKNCIRPQRTCCSTVEHGNSERTQHQALAHRAHRRTGGTWLTRPHSSTTHNRPVVVI